MTSYLITGGEVIVVLNGKTLQADDSQPNYPLILDAIKAGEWDKLPALMDRTTYINQNGAGKVTVVNGQVMFNGAVLHNSMADRIIEMLNEGFDIAPMVLFLQNLMQNPSKESINELYGFLEACKLPITEDGHFVAYKRVGSGWKDLHSNSVCNKPVALMTEEELLTFPQTVGAVTTRIVDGQTEVSMLRERVDSNRHRTCSDGLHFCSLKYLDQFYSGQGHIILLKINPADVVSIPSDYKDTKGRTCRYTVMSEVSTDTGNLEVDVFNESVVTNTALEDSAEYKEGYIFGYDEGKRKAEKFSADIDSSAARYAGYLEGYKDGRGHSKRKYSKGS